MTSYPTESNAVTNGVYMNNLDSVAEFLMANGFSQAAAAGVSGVVAGESGGNPESQESGDGGGQGLIQWTPGSSASPITPIITGDAQKDFDAQLTDMLSYANSNSAEAVARGGVDLNTLKTATDPNQAATWWSEFEGPAVPGSDIRSNIVSQVYSNLNGYKPNSGYTQPDSSSGGATASTTADTKSNGCPSVTLNPLTWINAPASAACQASAAVIGSLENDVIDWAERLGLIILGAVFIIIGIVRISGDHGKNAAGAVNGKVSDSVKDKFAASPETEAAEVAA